tara:strand:- start:78 stop:1865 length:1788 start_codon:yes stop_codon:yes gene_type:complete
MAKGKNFEEMTKEDDILEVFKSMRDEAREKVEPRAKEIQRNYLTYLGNHYLRENEEGWTADDKAPSWRFRVKRDIIGPMVDTLRPILMRGYPKYYVEADYPELPAMIETEDGQQVPTPMREGDSARFLQNILEAFHEERGEGIEVAKLLVDVLVGGIAYRKVTFCPQTNRVRLPHLNFEDLLPDPYGTRSDFGDHKYVIIRNEMDCYDIERIYGVKEKDFGGDNEDDFGDGLFKTVKTMFNKKSSQKKDTVDQNETWKRRRYDVWELYYNEMTPMETEFGKAPPKAVRYPKGRHIVIINDKVVAVDRENPYWHGQFPLITYNANPLPHEFFGKSDVDSMVSIQSAGNILQNMVIQNAMLSTNTQWIYEEGALSAEELTNEPGLMIPVAPGGIGRLQRLEPASISRDAMALIEQLEGHARSDISGVQDVMMGREPTSNSSGVLANTLQSAALTRQGFKIQSLDEGYKRQAILEVSLIQQFYNFEDPHVTRKMQMGELMQWNEAIRNLTYDVVVESKADMPHNVVSRMNIAMQLMQMGVFDIMEFLDYTGLKIREDLRNQLIGASLGGGGQQGQGQGGIAGQENLGSGVPQQAIPSM